MKKINQENYFKDTVGNFREVKNVKGALKKLGIPNTSTSSEYWFTNQGLFRYSDHWGVDINSCSWFINYESMNKKRLGYIDWDKLYSQADLKLDPLILYLMFYLFRHTFRTDLNSSFSLVGKPPSMLSASSGSN
jgi:hypothetical protein